MLSHKILSILTNSFVDEPYRDTKFKNQFDKKILYMKSADYYRKVSNKFLQKIHAKEMPKHMF